MLTDAEHEEVLRAIGYARNAYMFECEGGWKRPGAEEWDACVQVAIDSPLVRAQMTDWLLERGNIYQEFDHDASGFFIKVTCWPGKTPREHMLVRPTLAEALAKCVLEVSRADN